MVEQEAVNFEVIGSSPILPAMEKLRIEDKSRIDKVIFNYPELMNERASELIKEKYSRMISLSNTLQDKRVEIRSLEEEERKARKEWEEIKSMITYSHPIVEKEYNKEECNFSIRGHGNDIIGRTSVM